MSIEGFSVDLSILKKRDKISYFKLIAYVELSSNQSSHTIYHIMEETFPNWSFHIFCARSNASHFSSRLTTFKIEVISTCYAVFLNSNSFLNSSLTPLYLLLPILLMNENKLFKSILKTFFLLFLLLFNTYIGKFHRSRRYDAYTCTKNIFGHGMFCAEERKTTISLTTWTWNWHKLRRKSVMWKESARKQQKLACKCTLLRM